MCYIINGGVLQGMSVVIGICGENFCTFWADGRRVVADDDAEDGFKVVGDDHFQKIFKLNSHVLYGAAGWFDSNTDLLAPVSKVQDIDHASVRVIKRAVIDYIKSEPDCLRELPNSYLVGGKNKDGSFLIYEIAWDKSRGKVSVVERKPSPPSSMFGISMMLPVGDQQAAQRCVDTASRLIAEARSHDELKHSMSSLIYSISLMDRAVGPDAMALSVF